jgi:hypothetical protein
MSVDIDRLGAKVDPGAVSRRDVAQLELHRLRRVLEDREQAAEVAAPTEPRME